MDSVRGTVQVTLDSYYEVIILTESVLCIVGWVWCMVINKRQGVGRFNMGNLAHVMGFCVLLHRNVTYYTAGTPRMNDEFFMQETLAISTCWFAGVVWFIITYYWNRWRNDEWGGHRELGAFNAEERDGDDGSIYRTAGGLSDRESEVFRRHARQ